MLAPDITIDTLDGILIADCREQLHNRVKTHTDETWTHLGRLESVFDIIGEEPTTCPVPAVDGWISDKEQFNNIILKDELRPLYYLGTVMKGEELEHSMYETILRLARNLEGEGERQQISELLEENAADKNEMLEDIKSVADSDSTRRLLEASQASSRRHSSLNQSQTRTLSINIETLDDLFVYNSVICSRLSRRLQSLREDE